MAAYHKVEVSLNTNAVEVGIPSPQSVTVTVPTVGPVGPQGPAGPKGDPGEVSGSIAWDNVTDKPSTFTPSSHTHSISDVTGLQSALDAAGSVDSVNGQTGVVTLTPADLDAANANHTHNAADLFFAGVEIAGAGNSNTNGVYVYGGDLNGKGVYYKDKDTFVYWDAQWLISYNSNDIYSSGQDTLYPWQVTSWSVETGQTSPAPSSWDRVTGDQWEAVVGQRTNPTLRGDAAGKNVGTGANDVAAGNDARFTDARQPLSHASTHYTGGTDALAAHQINGQTIFSTGSPTYSTDQTLGAARALQLTVSNTNAGGINLTLPVQSDGTLNGDTYVIVGGSTVSGPITIRRINVLSPLIYETLATITATGQQYRFRATGATTGGWTLVPVDSHTHPSTQITGLGTAATQDSTAFAPASGIDPTAITGTAVVDSDARLSDSRLPTAHKNSHSVGQADFLAPSDIGAQSIFVTEALGTVTANVTLTAARAKIYTLNTTTSGLRILFPASDVLAGDIVQIRFTSSTGQSITPVRGTMTGFFTNDIGPTGGPVTFIAASASGTSWAIAPVDRHVHGNIGDQGNIGTTSGLPIKTGSGGVLQAGAFGTGAGEFAEGNHTHADLHTRSHAITSTSDHTAGNHKVFYSNGSGEIVELALGNSGEVLTSNGATSAPSFAAASGGGVTGAAASASDVLGVSGSDITGVDAGSADRLVFWDDSASKLTYLEAGSGLSISGTTLTATSTFDPASPDPIGTTTPSTGAFTSLSTAPAANTSALTATGYSLTGSNAQSLVDLAGTWNTSGTPSAIKLNITDTASNANSLLMQLQTGGTNRFTVTKGGAVSASFFSVGTGDFRSNGFPVLRSFTTEMLCFATNSNVNIAANGLYSIGWASGAPTGTDADVRMWRDAAATWALRNGVNAQEMRCYGTFTSSTNYQRMTIKSVKQTLSALSGASATTTGTFIPDGAVVVGVTTRVATALTGASGYEVGDGTDADRWGDITGTAIGTTSDNRDWTAGTIECFTAGGEITLTAKTSNFTAGAIEICVFYLAGEAD